MTETKKNTLPEPIPVDTKKADRWSWHDLRRCYPASFRNGAGYGEGTG